MQIVGGTYSERCAFPRHDELVGSGMRAAATLANWGTDLLLTSAVHESEAGIARVTAGPFGVSAEWVDRSRAIGFSSFTPLSAPTIDGYGSTLFKPIEVSGDVVLAFGMIEAGNVRVSGRRVVVDPQRPRNLKEEDLPEVSADDTIWTLNERETRQLGGSGQIETAAARLVETRKLTAVVTKRGPRGVLVTTADGRHQPVGARETKAVFPIGSGDVFAAAFAWAWGIEGADPLEAADFGSTAAAHWCETRDYLASPSRLRSEFSRRVVPTLPARPIYLAGPFFNLQQRWMIDVVKDALSPGVWSPSHEVGPGGLEVAKMDLEGLEQCDAVLALLDDNDPGTIFEIGYATKMGIPVVLFASKLDAEGGKMLLGTGSTHFTDLSTAVYKAQWAAAFHASERH